MNNCPHCGAKLWGRMVSRCYKCGASVDVRSETEAQRVQETRLERQRIAQSAPRKREHACFRRAIMSGNACVFYQKHSVLEAYTGEIGWEIFVCDIVGGFVAYTCFRCPACRYVHVTRVEGDINSVYGPAPCSGNIYLIRRGIGRCGTDNWLVSFRCHRCGRSWEDMHVRVSWDSATNEYGEPFAQVFSFKEVYLHFLR